MSSLVGLVHQRRDRVKSPANPTNAVGGLFTLSLHKGRTEESPFFISSVPSPGEGTEEMKNNGCGQRSLWAEYEQSTNCVGGIPEQPRRVSFFVFSATC